jgi:hypothetical protein
MNTPAHGQTALFVRTLVALVEAVSWRVALALTLKPCLTVAEGAHLLRLEPIRQWVALNLQQGFLGWLAELISSILAAVTLIILPCTIRGLSPGGLGLTERS